MGKVIGSFEPGEAISMVESHNANLSKILMKKQDIIEYLERLEAMSKELGIYITSYEPIYLDVAEDIEDVSHMMKELGDSVSEVFKLKV